MMDYRKVTKSYLYNNKLSYRIKLFIFALFFKLDIKCVNAITGPYLAISSRESRGPSHLEVLRRNCFSGTTGELYLSSSFSMIHFFFMVKYILTYFNVTSSLSFSRLLEGKFKRDEAAVRRYFRNELSQVTHLISLFDAAPYENLFVQVAKQYMCKTFTCQHGLYSFNTTNEPSPDDTAYECFVSDYLLTWCPSTIDEFSFAGIERERFIIVGNQTINGLDAVKNVYNAEDNKNCFGVLLSGENQKSVNFKLLTIAEDFCKMMGKDWHYIVRCHPRNKVSDYEDYISHRCQEIATLDDVNYFSKVVFSISYKTGLIALSLECAIPIYIYDDEKLPFQYRIDKLNFKNAHDLKSLLKSDESEFKSVRSKFVSKKVNIDFAEIVKSLEQA